MAANAKPSTSGDDRNLVTIDENYLAPTFEDRLQIFWEKNSRLIVAVIVAVALALVVRWAFGLFAERRELAIQAAYAEASTSAQLQAFVTSHPRSALAGVASLRLADEAYAAGNYAEAREGYLAAAPLLAQDPLGARARVGAAISPLLAGDTAAAKVALEELANDTSVAETARAEAAYHLAVVARDAGDAAEATRWTGQVLAIGPESMWAQRAMQLRAALPLPEAAAPAVATEANTLGAPVATEASPAIAFPGAQ